MAMRCVTYHCGKARDEIASLLLDPGGVNFVVRGVAAPVCDIGDEEYVGEETA